jgi:peptidyl-tRNA hydrolase, PTH1 family
VLDYFKLPLSAVLVVVDEVALDVGQVRLRASGSPGGHNGLKSIESHLKTREYARLRVGVGAGECAWRKCCALGGLMHDVRVCCVCAWAVLVAAGPGQLVDHVLGEFSRSEKAMLDDVLNDSCDAIEDWIANDDQDKVMSRVNAPRAKA